MSGRLKSRKLWGMVLTNIAIEVMVVLGGLDQEVAAQIIGFVTSVYVASQGYADGKSVESTVPAGREAVSGKESS